MLLAAQKIAVRSDGYFLQQQYFGCSKSITSLHTVFKQNLLNTQGVNFWWMSHKKWWLITALIVEGSVAMSSPSPWAFQTQVMNDCVQLLDNARVAELMQCPLCWCYSITERQASLKSDPCINNYTKQLERDYFVIIMSFVIPLCIIFLPSSEKSNPFTTEHHCPFYIWFFTLFQFLPFRQ